MLIPDTIHVHIFHSRFSEIQRNTSLDDGLIPFTKLLSEYEELTITDDNVVVNPKDSSKFTGLLACNNGTTLLSLFPAITEVSFNSFK